jgi:hypothetical protein
MSNLTVDRVTEYVAKLDRDELPVAANVTICNGAAVALVNGYAHHAGAGKKHFRGIADQTVTNGATHGAVTINVLTPDAAWWDQPSSPFGVGDVGKQVFFADDHTLTATAGNNTYAGKIKAIGDGTINVGVLVDHRGAYATELLTGAATTAG